MNLIDLLQSDAATLPGIGEQDFEAQLGRRFDDYFAEFGKITATDPASKMAKHNLPASVILASKVLSALGAWLDGQPSRAATALDEGLASASAALGEHVSVPVAPKLVGPLFRLSVVDSGPVTRGRLFHIPFEMRDRVATRRYSFPGLPCVYLGRSAYICWIECDRPSLDVSWISKFIVADGQWLRVLDFGRSPAMTGEMLVQHPDRASQAAAYAILWPLIAACSMRKRPESSSGFTVEYVIPQLLLRWIADGQLQPNWATEVRIDGIRFFSTRVDADELGIAAMNYAFPTQTRSKAGYCQTLSTKLHLTPPAKWTIAAAHTASATYNQVSIHLNGVTTAYQHTDFSRVEAYLDTLAPGPVS